MSKKELELKLVEINNQLKALGDLNTLLQQSQSLPNIINDIETKKGNIETFLTNLPTRSEELDRLTVEAKNLNEQVSNCNNEVSGLSEQTKNLQDEVKKLIDETRVQLGKAANEKLANSFGKVKDELIEEKKRWFKWLVGSVIGLSIITFGIVVWEVVEFGSLYQTTFLIKIGITSPVVYFIVFINREYNRVRGLIEEYTFKASIARSFEAYKDIVEGIFSEQQSSVFNEKLKFVLTSITDLYSSPMKNIKINRFKEKDVAPDLLSGMKNLVKETEE